MRARFWRNVMLIALAHVTLLLALWHWASGSKINSGQEITWLTADAGSETDESVNTLEPMASASALEPAQSAPASKSEIILASPTPPPTAKATAKPTPKATPRKTTPKPSSTVTKNKAAASSKKKENSAKKPGAGNPKIASGGSGDGGSGNGSGKTDAATATYYGNMLHDRFYHAWEQPQTVVASGVKLSTIVRIRIEKDGRVSDFKIVKPSGNVLVDESVEAVSKKVTQVDALPPGAGSDGHYDVNVNFALNSE